ncbi:MAG TPA: DUF2759 family protein [Bacillota bacterium]|nr:DUF2759 family protein [Bacillota bacterium]
MVMTLILILVTLTTGYGILQTKRQGNKFGFGFSVISFLVLLFITGLALIM